MQRIPKIIHYCWFGGKPLPEEFIYNIETWKKYCDDYIIKKWYEGNFPIQNNIYCKEAYCAKKYAFVSDYARLFFLYNYGGIYMDTDVEVVKGLDRFLCHSAFSGFESNAAIPTGIMGSTKGNSWIKILLNYYNNKNFIKCDGTFDLTTNVEIVTKITREFYNLTLANQYIETDDGVAFYPSEYFCPKNGATGVIRFTNNTYTIHHFSGSWTTDDVVKIKLIKRNILEKYKFLNKVDRNWLGHKILKKLIPFYCRFRVYGIKDILRRMVYKLCKGKG
jgi:mannosyltransferase OCH1-like enzyme